MLNFFRYANDSLVARAFMRPPTILVVDDDVKVLTFLHHTLKRGGFHVLAASDGAEVPDLLSRNHVDALVLDLQMPGVNGWEVLRKLRPGADLQKRRATKVRPKVVVVSARTEEETEAFARRLGADAYLTKPLWGAQLLATVRQVLTN
jgi:DNA-binding response OmpR family regulator